ncbi:MAG: hypothetical protein J5892_00310 [Bacilli bacterium]|nr:hypothetical protein [Bacilli bacterium]
MKYLEDLGFTKEQIKLITNSASELLCDAIKENKKLITVNLNYLKDLGVANYKEIFCEYYEIFLNEPSAFRSTFEKYEKDSLIEKLAEDIRVIEFL